MRLQWLNGFRTIAVRANASVRGTGAIGTAATLKAFTTADLKAFHAAAFQPGNATLIAVGDITADSVVPQLEKHFGSWRAGSTAARHAAVPECVPTCATSDHDRRYAGCGTVTSPHRLGRCRQIHTGLLHAAGAQHDLGGSFTSRLNQNLREEHGYSYGASSRFDMRLSAGPFFAGAGVQTDKTAESIREFFNELTAIGKPVAADELTKAKNYVAFGFPQQLRNDR